MPRWKPRDPSKFPARFEQVTLRAYNSIKPQLLQTVRRNEAKKLRDIFREWRFCLRTKGTPADPCFTIERDWRICTVIYEEGSLVHIWVEIRPRILSSLESLNPSLELPK